MSRRFPSRRGGLRSRGLSPSGDQEIARLERALARRQARVAELQLELFDTRAEVARFEREMEARLGPLQARLEALQEALRQARHRAALRGQWGERVDRGEVPVDVQAQFERTWRPRASPPPPRKPEPKDERSLKDLYRELARRYHPDLTTDPEEKHWRSARMAEINQAYREGNLEALQRLAEAPARPEPAPPPTREARLAALQAEIRRLDGVIARLEAELGRLTRSHIVALMLEASLARRAGRDLLAEMAADLEAQIAEVQAELASLG